MRPNPLRRLPNNPHKLVHQTDVKYYYGKIKALPAWYSALRQAPPAAPPLRTCIPQQVGAFVPETKSASKRPQDHYYREPFDIRYPEDDLRDLFYKTHPYELHRPRKVQDEDVKWTSIMAGRQLTGESVVQRTLFLEKSEALDRDAAYQTALKEFYEARKQEEKNEHAARKLARQQGADTDIYAGKPVTKAFAKIEELNLEKMKQEKPDYLFSRGTNKSLV